MRESFFVDHFLNSYEFCDQLMNFDHVYEFCDNFMNFNNFGACSAFCSYKISKAFIPLGKFSNNLKK